MVRATAAFAAALLAAAGLTGCATAPVIAPGCQAQLAAEVPLRLVDGFPVAPVRVNGAMLSVLVDTGFAKSLLTPATAARLGLAPDPGHVVQVGGAGGTTTASTAVVTRLQVGDMSLGASTVLIGSLPEPETMVSGVLGDDWLARFDVDMDLPRGRLALWRVEGCDAGRDPLGVPHLTVPMRRLRDGFLLLPVTLDGARIGAMLDSGARFTSVLPAAAAYVGVPAAELSGAGVGTATGVDLRPLPVRLHRFAEFRIGTETFRNIVMPVVGIKVPLVGVLVGANYLAHHRVWISRTFGSLFIVPVP